MADTVVKLDKELKERIEKLISKGDNRFDYPSVKNFVDKAVLKLLDEENTNSKDKENNKKNKKGGRK